MCSFHIKAGARLLRSRHRRMGRPRKVRTSEEEAAYQESRRAAHREYQRRRRLEPARLAEEAAAKRRRRAGDPEYVQQENARERERKRRLREDPDVREAEKERYHARKSVALPARSVGVVQGNRAVQRDQSTSCEKGVSKSAQANILTRMVSGWTQTEEVQDFHDASSPLKVPLPSKGEPPLVAFLNRSAIAIQMLLHSNEAQESQVEGVTKQHPLDCRGHSLVAAGPPKGTEGIDAFAQSCITKEVTDKTTWCAGISEAELYSPKVSSWMQSEDLEDSDDYS
ncbi:uncharacterized protein LOC125759539 isoform X3 [Rhipicephalus sanguineus]|uniref:uncharacterized protein LOC125759539 isoform X3 n=1 Tax=Rhipicephalus sanguineus TaxID=34632 RepID=UPI0020C2CCFD|nr:uncharacterized protein LOC125759539 isoform X3 [Rhipicephalus sanguineus]